MQSPHLTSEEIRVENISICNFKCNFCPYPSTFIRQKETMSESLYEFVMNKTKEECPQITKTCFSGMGEPFLDKKIYDKIKIAKSLGFRTKIISNGSRIDVDKVYDSGLDELRISLHGMKKDVFKRLTGGDLDVVLNNLDALIDKGVNISLNSVHAEEDPEDVQAIVDRYADRVSLLEIWRPHNWAGNTEDFRSEREKDSTCDRPFIGPINVMANADIAVCCFDANNTMNLGNLKEQSYEEIFTGEMMQKVQKAHETRNFCGLICEDCDLIKNKKDTLVYSSSHYSKEDRENLSSSYIKP